MTLSGSEKFMKNLIQRTLAVFLVLLFFTTDSESAKDIREFDQKKNQLIGYILDKAASHHPFQP